MQCIGRGSYRPNRALADSIEAIIHSIVETRKPVVGVEINVHDADQSGNRFWMTYWHPFCNDSGQVIGINVAAEEITERKRAEAALRASEQQFRTLADAIPQLVWISEERGKISWTNTHLSDFAHDSSQSASDADWIESLRPEEHEEARRLWTSCLETGTAFEMELSLRRADNEAVTCLTRIVPFHDQGAAVRWIGTHVDISERKRRENHIQVISRELSHRTKNLMSVVMAIACQTAKGSESVGQYHKLFSERLAALAHCHDLLVRDNWGGVSPEELVAMQMKPFQETHAGRINTAGPFIFLQPEAVQNLGLALHELATNAIKHGALSTPEGMVSIRWSVNASAATVCVDWCESGGPAVVAPRRRGFGNVVIMRSCRVPSAERALSNLRRMASSGCSSFRAPSRSQRPQPLIHDGREAIGVGAASIGARRTTSGRDFTNPFRHRSVAAACSHRRRRRPARRKDNAFNGLGGGWGTRIRT